MIYDTFPKPVKYMSSIAGQWGT